MTIAVVESSSTWYGIILTRCRCGTNDLEGDTDDEDEEDIPLSLGNEVENIAAAGNIPIP